MIRRPLILIAMAFWTTLLGVAVLGIWKGAHGSPEGAYLVAIPAVMLAVTAYAARAARNPRLTPGVMAGGTLLAAFAALLWVGALGAGV